MKNNYLASIRIFYENITQIDRFSTYGFYIERVCQKLKILSFYFDKKFQNFT